MSADPNTSPASIVWVQSPKENWTYTADGRTFEHQYTVEHMRLSQLRQHEVPSRHRVDKIVKAMRAGQAIESPEVDETGMVLDGHSRIVAAIRVAGGETVTPVHVHRLVELRPTLDNIPVIQLDRVFHIGTLDATQRGAQGESLEGHLLSVSLAPDAWRRIARLGGNPLHELERVDGLQLLDLHAAEADASVRSLIEQWGIAQGLLERKTLWRAWNYDSDCEDWRYTLHASPEEADKEVWEDEDPTGPNDGPAVEPHELLAGTPTLAALVQIRDLGKRDAFDYAAMIWAERTQPQLDGVWWEEIYDPGALSAPRGGLFASRLSNLRISELDWANAPSDVESLADLNSGRRGATLTL